jgi:hypothetical protein
MVPQWHNWRIIPENILQQGPKHEALFCFDDCGHQPCTGPLQSCCTQQRPGLHHQGGRALTWTGESADCYLEMYVYVLEGERVSFWALGGTFKKSQIKIVSSWELLMIWNSSNCSRNTRPECSYGDSTLISNRRVLQPLSSHTTDDIKVHSGTGEAFPLKSTRQDGPLSMVSQCKKRRNRGWRCGSSGRVPV